jgi:hypothetical protein
MTRAVARGGGNGNEGLAAVCNATLETAQGQIDGFFSQLPFKCYLPAVASVEN